MVLRDLRTCGGKRSPEMLLKSCLTGLTTTRSCSHKSKQKSGSRHITGHTPSRGFVRVGYPGYPQNLREKIVQFQCFRQHPPTPPSKRHLNAPLPTAACFRLGLCRRLLPILDPYFWPGGVWSKTWQWRHGNGEMFAKILHLQMIFRCLDL